MKLELDPEANAAYVVVEDMPVASGRLHATRRHAGFAASKAVLR